MLPPAKESWEHSEYRHGSPVCRKKDGKLILTVTDAFMKKDLNNLTVYTSVPVTGEEVTKQKKESMKSKCPS